MEIPERKRFISKGFELGTTLSKPHRSIGEREQSKNEGKGTEEIFLTLQ